MTLLSHCNLKLVDTLQDVSYAEGHVPSSWSADSETESQSDSDSKRGDETDDDD